MLGTENYNRWKGHTEVYVSREPLVIRAVQKSLYEFFYQDGKPKDFDDLTEAELIKYGYNGKARTHEWIVFN